MSCCSSSSITPCTISVNDALSLLDCTCNSCGSLCENSAGTPMPPSPLPQYASYISVEDYTVFEGVFNILNFEASGASFSTVTNNGAGRCTINVDTQLVEKILYQDAVNLLSNSDLIPGKLYWIYDVGDALTVANGGLNTSVTAANAYAGIVLKALDVDKFDTNGAYIARVPDRTKSVYFGNDNPTYPINSYVEHFNFIYTNSGGPLTGPFVLPPSVDSANWTLLTKDDSRYVTDVYSCVYDILNDQILSITDTSNNTVSVANITGGSVNELFLYCFRWGAYNFVYGNKITINGLTQIANSGFIAGNYPKLSQLGINVSINFNYSNHPFFGNEITIDAGKLARAFTSIRYDNSQPSFCSFYYNPPSVPTPPQFSNNKILNSFVYINRYAFVDNNDVSDSTLGTLNVGIINFSVLSPFGNLINNKITRCRIRATGDFDNTGTIDNCDIADCTFEENIDTEISFVSGSVDIIQNTSCTILYVHGLNKSNDSVSFRCENVIGGPDKGNINVLIESLSGDRFDIIENENISIRHNVRLYQGNIARNTAPLNPIILDENGTGIITTADNRKACSIIQCELDNFSTISDCTWETAGAIARVKLSRAELKFLSIDFRDSGWTGLPIPPPPIPDMLIDTQNVYLWQNRNKLANSLYPCPAVINGLTATASSDIDGTASGGGPTKFPLLNAYVYTPGPPDSYDYMPFISSDSPYCTGAVLSNFGSDGYVFLNVNDFNVLNAGELKLQAWTQHASIIYLYSGSGGTFNINKINDLANGFRPNYKFRIVALSDGLTVNIGTTAIAGVAANQIVSSLTPSATAVVLSRRHDILEIEKRNNQSVVAIYYITNVQTMI